MQEMNRRSFVKGAGAGIAASAVVASPALACDCPDKTDGIIPTEWDYETEVLIVGFGAAGVNAALASCMAGVKTMVIEAAPEEYSGGNTSVSGGGFVQPYDHDIYVNYLNTCSYGMTPSKYNEIWADALAGICDWLDELDLAYTCDRHNYGHWLASGDAPEVVSAIAGLTESGVDHYTMLDEDGNGCTSGGVVLRQFLSVLDEYDYTILYDTRGEKLYQDPFTREVKGLRAIDKDGNSIDIKASKGVILACGGFENNPELIDSHIRSGARIFPSGTPFNRGDGVLMAQEIGAKMWHMNGIEWQCYGVRPYDYIKTDIPMAGDVVVSSHWDLDPRMIQLNPYGDRFYPEDRFMAHTKQLDGMDFVGYADKKDQLDDYKARWAFMIFDQGRFEQYPEGDGEIYAEGFEYIPGVITTMGWFPARKLFKWDLDQALESGLLCKADTLEELFEKLGLVYVDRALATVERWNGYVDAGEDLDFHRDPEHMYRIDQPPFYGCKLWPSFINTQGGPVHNNMDCRVTDMRDEEIPRLYATGELGSVYSLLYHGSGNVAEAIVTGKNAGFDCAALENWDA